MTDEHEPSEHPDHRLPGEQPSGEPRPPYGAWPPPGQAPQSGPTPPPQGPQQGPHQGPHQGPQQGPHQGPHHTQPMPRPFGPGPAYSTPEQPAKTRTGRVSGWVWPAVAALALVIGLVGGAIGGVAVQSVWGSQDDSGRVSGGVGGVDTVSVPPVKPGNTSVAAVAKQLLPSTVQVMADYQGQDLGSTGSGWIFDKQGHIITNNHVIAGAANGGDIVIVDHQGNRHQAKLVGRSTDYDIAVLYVEDAKQLSPAALGSSKALNVGDPVVAIGSPLGLNETVTSGIISATDRPVTTGETEQDTSYINALQTDAAINPGNSGGPLVNMQGQVVGVNSAIATTGGVLGGQGGNIGVGFAIPVEQVVTTADQILRTGKAQYPIIGAKVMVGGQAARSSGALVDEVTDGGPADDAGLEKGDVITAVDGEKVPDGESLIVAIRTHQPGDTITLTVRRDGKTSQLDVKLAAAED